MVDPFLTRMRDARGFASKLWSLARPYWYAQERQELRVLGFRLVAREAWIARGLLLLIVGLSFFIVYLSKELNAWNARFFNALQEKNADAFWAELMHWVLLVALFIIAFVYRQWLTQMLTVRWRRWLSEVYFRDWLADRTYYHMELTRQGTDNPEQRIEQDCASFASQTLSIGLGLLLQVLTLITFASVLWELSGNFAIPLLGGLVIPGYMMWVAIAYALLGSYATYLIGRPLVAVSFELERRNADFRYRMVRIRENAESIALYRGEADEERSLRASFASIYDTWWSFMTYNKRLTWITAFYGQAASIFPMIVAAPQYFAGQISLGVLTQTADAFAQVQGALSWFVDTFATLAAWKAVVDRLTTFSDAMVKAKEVAKGNAFEEQAHSSSEVVLEDVEVRLPDGQVLMADVDLTIRQGESVVLSGPSGSGKTTLFRVLAGLWPFGRGRIGVPQGARVLFLPQKPYLPMGSLKDVLSYPEMPEQHTDQTCREVLALCGLGELAPRLLQQANWSLVLSGGEQQRLAFARALLYRPDWLFLDEATSALDAAAEAQMYALVRERLAGAAVISVAHRPQVAAMHHRRLVIDADGRRLVSTAVEARR
jgi:putative ATP-binding cassette transporter